MITKADQKRLDKLEKLIAKAQALKNAEGGISKADEAMMLAEMKTVIFSFSHIDASKFSTPHDL